MRRCFPAPWLVVAASMGAAVAANAAAPARARTGAAEPPTFAATGACPSEEMVRGAIATLIPRQPLASTDPARIELVDLGDSYRVSVLMKDVPRERIYRDLGHDCEQRARFAAVFIVLTLMPPELLIDITKGVATERPSASDAPRELARSPEPTVVPSSLPTASAPAPLVTPQPVAPSGGVGRAIATEIELGAVSEFSPGIAAAPSLASFGAMLRASWGGRRFAGALGVALLPWTELTVGGVRARQSRIPIDVGLRVAGRARGLEYATVAGAVGELLVIEGVNTATPARGTRLGAGLRVGGAVRLGHGRLAPIVGVHGVWFPRPFELVTTPGGDLGKTATFWLGVTVGVSWAATRAE